MSEPIKNPTGLYTTGEVAKFCGVSVRTVQYYDTRGILIPSSLTEGGRRLYTEEDVNRMKVICFLRELDLPINSISKLLAEEHPERVIELLLAEQERDLKTELGNLQEKLDKLTGLRRAIPGLDEFSLESIGDIAIIMEHKKKLRRIRWNMVIIAILAEIIEVGSVLLWVLKGIWWPAVVGLPLFIALCTWLVIYYYQKIVYICPACHRVFRPTVKDFMFSNHTPTTRKLTCPVCGHRGFCVETHHAALPKDGKQI